ncbi:Serine-threonine/tyrosine-protein kinase, catalytic domain, partial [Sesbania bispinosa]
MHWCTFSPLQLPILLLSLTFLNHTAYATHISYPPPPYYNCSSNNTNYAPNSIYHTNLQTLLSRLSSNATTTTQIYSTIVEEGNDNTVYGLFMCRIGDGEPAKCKECVINSTKAITKLCPLAKEAILWDSNCFVRYSNRYFFTTVEESPKLSFMNEQDYEGQVGHFNSILWDTMNEVRNRTASAPLGSMKYGYKSVNITANQTLYAMEYCIPYLPSDNCSWCLSDAIAEIPTSCCRGKTGGRVIYPSCGLRYELYPFYHPLASNSTPLPQLPATVDPLNPLASPGKGEHSRSAIVVVVPVVVSMVLLTLACGCFLSSRRRKNHETILKESCEIESSTNKFARENMIGKGGFGEVYKGVLPNGQEIAVKRLLGSSGQGAIEFKNEVLVIAQLQHRNLVKLQGFCLDGQEKILIYEYVPNKSLDYFLF